MFMVIIVGGSADTGKRTDILHNRCVYIYINQVDLHVPPNVCTCTRVHDDITFIVEGGGRA